MPRKSNLKSIEVENPDFEEPEILKETKFDNLLSYLSDTEEDFYITLYRLKERGKRVAITKFYNVLPDQFEDIQKKYGGGEYRLIVHAKDKSDGKYKMVDSADINIENIETSQPTQQNNTPNREQFLQEVKTISEIFSSHPKSDSGNSNDLLMKLMDMQTKMTTDMMKFQQDSERRMTDMLMQMNSKKPALNEFLEIAETISMLKGESEPQSMTEKILSNPNIQPVLISGLNKLNSFFSSSPEEKQPVQEKPKAADILKLLPPEYIAKVNKENAEKMALILYEKNKNNIDMATASAIILEILKSKEV